LSVSSAETKRVVHVVAGVLKDAADRILLAQRPPGKHLAGGWEFPGGKVEPGETRLATLRRELQEELGVDVQAARPLLCVRHAYPERVILLDVWIVTQYRGEPTGREGQGLRWCPREALPDADLLPADKPIVTALRLPERLMARENSSYVIVESLRVRAASASDRLLGVFCARLAEATAAAEAGADFLVTRAEFGGEDLAALCAAVAIPVYARGMPLTDAWQLGAAGVYGEDL
jgi:8-oxo-dGTP diphosphatase